MVLVVGWFVVSMPNDTADYLTVFRTYCLIHRCRCALVHTPRVLTGTSFGLCGIAVECVASGKHISPNMGGIVCSALDNQPEPVHFYFTIPICAPSPFPNYAVYRATYSTHAQKYFQKLSKAQASGTSHLDPATLMSTMDAGKPRPASVAR